MRQLKATQFTPQYGAMTLHIRFVSKYIFLKGSQTSTKYVDHIIENMKKKGAIIHKGNGGWVSVDIIKNNEQVKLGDVEFRPNECTAADIENILCTFYTKKFTEAKFAVQEVIE